MLITQYILNLGENSYSYVGSGTIVISGSATSRQVYEGIYNSQFQVGEYIYDQNHIIWQILSISGPIDNPVYYTQSGSQYSYFNGSQIFKLSQESSVFNQIFDAQIDSYDNTIAYIDSIPPPPDVTYYSEITPKFEVGQYVLDAQGTIWKILEIQNSVNEIIYVAIQNNITQDFFESEIFFLSQENNVMDAYTSATIENYQNVLDRINEIDPPSDVVDYENIIIPFSVGEFVFTSDNTIWKIIAIQSSVNSVSYKIENSNQIAVVQENQIFKMNQENQVIDSIYNNSINYYTAILAQINNQINNF